MIRMTIMIFFEKTIFDARSNYFAPKSVSFKKYKHKINQWITQGILNSIRYRDKLYRKLIKTDPNSHTYLAMQLNLRTYKCLLKKAIRNNKIENYATQFNNSKSNIRHTWCVVKEILNKCKNQARLSRPFHCQWDKYIKCRGHLKSFQRFFCQCRY